MSLSLSNSSLFLNWMRLSSAEGDLKSAMSSSKDLS